MSVFFLTFLLFNVPLNVSRALAQSSELAQAETPREVLLGGESEQVANPPEASDASAVVDSQGQSAASSGAGAPATAEVNTKNPKDGVNPVRPKFDDVANPCLRDLGEMDCILTYGFRAIEFHAIGEEVIARFQRLDGTVNDADVIVMGSHLEDAALNDRINLDESPVIFAQFQQLSGARYEIPRTANEIKRSLGFSEETPIAPVDWLEILKVHLERTLSTTPTVSDLILDLLGVELNPVVIETN